jgi:hypothetical protein
VQRVLAAAGEVVAAHADDAALLLPELYVLPGPVDRLMMQQ